MNMMLVSPYRQPGSSRRRPGSHHRCAGDQRKIQMCWGLRFRRIDVVGNLDDVDVVDFI